MCRQGWETPNADGETVYLQTGGEKLRQSQESQTGTAGGQQQVQPAGSEDDRQRRVAEQETRSAGE